MQARANGSLVMEENGQTYFDLTEKIPEADKKRYDDAVQFVSVTSDEVDTDIQIEAFEKRLEEAMIRNEEVLSKLSQ